MKKEKHYRKTYLINLQQLCVFEVKYGWSKRAMALYNVNWIKEVGKESRNWEGGGVIFSFWGGRKNGPVKWKKRRR